MPTSTARPMLGLLGPTLILGANGTAIEIDAMQRRVLAALYVFGGRSPIDQLADQLTEPRSDVQRAVDALAPHITSDRGLLHFGEIDVDIDRFDAIAAAGNETDHDDLEAALRSALALWRGPALIDLADLDWAAPQTELLESRRAETVERRAQALLAAVRHRDAIPDLEALLQSSPEREVATQLLMRALGREGRLEAVQRTYDRHIVARAMVPGLGTPAPETTGLLDRLNDGWVEAATPGGAIQAPTGTVTFLFTDIESSTHLWETDPVGMTAALEHHDEILRRQFQDRDGFIFATGGDAYAVAFSSTTAAVAAAITVQEELTSTAWPTSISLKVRIGIHQGVAQERDGDYFGSVVNRAARIMSAAHGGQVIVSPVVSAVVQEEATTHSLGRFRLKDVAEPIELHQVEIGGLPASFPTPRGTALDKAAEEAPQWAEEGERRQLTVLFADLVSDPNADPEDELEIADTIAMQWAAAVETRGGYVANNTPTSFLAYFGYPVSYEDNGRRAVDAGFDLITNAAEVKLAARVGIHTGLAVISIADDDTGRTRPNVVGNTMTVAANVKAAAPAGHVVVTAAVGQLLGVAARLLPAGHSNDGFEMLIVAELFDARGAETTATGFQGRESELRMLHERWQSAVAGTGQTVLLVGEPGIGKSRLAQEFADSVTPTGGRLVAQASAYEADQPHALVSQLFSSCYGPFDDRTRAERLDQIREDLRVVMGEADAETGAQILVTIAGAGETGAATDISSVAGEEQAAWIAAWLQARSARGPVLVQIEDLHWADPSSLEAIDEISEQSIEMAVLVLASTRPEFEPDWTPLAHRLSLRLPELTADDVRSLIRAGVDENGIALDLDDATIDQVIERAEGVPLFVEALVRDLANAPSGSRDVPTALHDLLAARLDRLGSAREVAQTAAVIGRDFDRDLLRELTDLSDQRLDDHLTQLRADEIVQVRRVGIRQVFSFTHALLRDAAYDSLLRATRRRLHGRTAEALSVTETPPAVIARHWVEAGDVTQAAHAWDSAGRRALAQNAAVEASRHFSYALNAMRAWEEPDYAHQLKVAINLVAATGMAHGWAAPETEPARSAIRELLPKVDDREQAAHALYSLWSSTIVSGDTIAAGVIAKEISEAGAALGNETLVALGDLATGNVALNHGDMVLARDSCERALAITRPDGAHVLEPSDLSQGHQYAGMAISYLEPGGDITERLTVLQAFVDDQTDLITGFTAQLAFLSIGVVRRDTKMLIEHGAALLADAERLGFAPFVSMAEMFLGYGEGLAGDASGLARHGRGLAIHRRQNMRLGLNGFLAHHAELQLLHGDLDTGLAVIHEALDNHDLLRHVRDTVEIRRVYGSLLAATGDEMGAVQQFTLGLAACESLSMFSARDQTLKDAHHWLGQEAAKALAAGAIQ